MIPSSMLCSTTFPWNYKLIRKQLLIYAIKQIYIVIEYPIYSLRHGEIVLTSFIQTILLGLGLELTEHSK